MCSAVLNRTVTAKLVYNKIYFLSKGVFNLIECLSRAEDN